MLVVALKQDMLHLTNYKVRELSEICSGLFLDFLCFGRLLCETCVVSSMAVGFWGNLSVDKGPIINWLLNRNLLLIGFHKRQVCWWYCFDLQPFDFTQKQLLFGADLRGICFVWDTKHDLTPALNNGDYSLPIIITSLMVVKSRCLVVSVVIAKIWREAICCFSICDSCYFVVTNHYVTTIKSELVNL